jgi:hypothetical protein
MGVWKAILSWVLRRVPLQQITLFFRVTMQDRSRYDSQSQISFSSSGRLLGVIFLVSSASSPRLEWSGKNTLQLDGGSEADSDAVGAGLTFWPRLSLIGAREGSEGGCTQYRSRTSLSPRLRVGL